MARAIDLARSLAPGPWSELGLPAADFDVAALHAAVDARRRAQGLSWQGIADAVNAPARGCAPRAIAASTLRALATKRWGVEGDTVLQVLLWLERTPESFVPGHPGAERPEARLPRMQGTVLRFDVPAIFARLDAQRTARGMSWAEVATEVGGLATAAGLRRLATSQRTSFPAVMRLSRWLACPVAALTRVSPV